MSGLTQDLIDDLIKDLPTFKENVTKFFNKEIQVAQFKGLSGPFGSYAERGAESAMFRMRFQSGRIKHEQLAFLADAIRRHDLHHLHFTTGQCIQVHGISGDTVTKLFAECHANGIYSRGAGGDHPRNLAATPTFGITDNEMFDISPYVKAANEYALSLVLTLKLPRKYKIALSSGYDNQTHVTFKDLGFRAKENGTFDVYAAGGLGPNPRLGVHVASDVNPGDILYHIHAMGQLFSEHGDYTSRAKARTRYIPARLGDDAFKTLYNEYLKKSFETQDLHFVPETYTVDKTGSDAPAPNHPRIHAQKQPGLCYVSYHPIGGDPSREELLTLLDTLSGIKAGEIRLTSKEGALIINLTAEEALHIAKLTENTAGNAFEDSLTCVGATVCQSGLQDSHGLLVSLIDAVKAAGIDASVLPSVIVSGCPSSCAAQQVGTVGLQGHVKVVDKAPRAAFAIFEGGSELFGTETFGGQVGIVTVESLPQLFVDLAKLLNERKQDFKAWRAEQPDAFKSFVERYV